MSSVMMVEFIVGGMAFLLINYISMKSIVASMRTELNILKEELEKERKNNAMKIDDLYDRTRYVMTGNEIRKMFHEEISPIKAKVDIINDIVITLKATNSGQ